MNRRSARRRAAAARMEPALPELDVSPLIDVSFLLLIFFLVTSSIRKSELDLTTNHTTSFPTPGAVEPLTIDIAAAASGEISCNGLLVETDLSRRNLPGLVAELESGRDLAKASGIPIMAVVDIADDASQQRFADVLNALAAAKIENLSIRSSTP